MTEDILFNNLYVGHSPEDAKKLAAETFEVKKPLEVAADKPDAAEEDDEESISFKDDPISFIRTRVLSFIEAAKLDPLEAFKSQPETGAALAGALFTLFGMLGALVSIIGGAQKPVVTKVGLENQFVLTDELIVWNSLRKRPNLPMKRKRLRPLFHRLLTRRAMV
jgi:hypothetical protein